MLDFMLGLLTGSSPLTLDEIIYEMVSPSTVNSEQVLAYEKVALHLLTVLIKQKKVVKSFTDDSIYATYSVA